MSNQLGSLPRFGTESRISVPEKWKPYRELKSSVPVLDFFVSVLDSRLILPVAISGVSMVAPWP